MSPREQARHAFAPAPEAEGTRASAEAFAMAALRRLVAEALMTSEHDLRIKVDAVTHCALVSHARAHGVEKFDVARDVLGKWAASQVHGARMLASCLRAKGEAGVAEGIARAAQGIAGQAGDSPLEWDES